MTTNSATARQTPIRQRRIRRIAAIAAVVGIPFTASLPGGTDLVEARTGTIQPLFDSGLVVQSSTGPTMAPDGTITPLFDSGLVVRG